jgi:hypothetical protein
VVLVEQPAESVAPAHCTWLALAGDVQASRGIRRPQLQRPVRTMGVVVGGIDPEDLLEMAAPDDQQPVQALSADRANPPLRVGVRVGRLHGGAEHLGALGPEHIVEAAGELRVTVTK